MAKVIGVDPGSGCWNAAGRATGGTGLVMVDGLVLVHYETVVGDRSDNVGELGHRVCARIAELLTRVDGYGDWTLAVEMPLNPVRRSRAVNASCVLAGMVYAWASTPGWCAEAVYVEAGRFPKVTPPAELVGRRFKNERRMNAPAPHLCATRDHEQDAYSLARYVQGQLAVAAA